MSVRPASFLYFCLFLIIWAGCLAPAQAQDSTLARLLTRGRLPLTATADGQLGGAGWDKLVKLLPTRAAVLVGESHGTAQIPQFVAALAREFRPAAFVTEIDPYQAEDLSRLAQQPGPPTAHGRAYPQTLSFFNWAEEFELARALRAQSVPIVGIEQVGYSMTGRLFGLMAGRVKSPVARAWLSKWAVAYQAQDRVALARDDFEKISMISLRQSAADSLLSFTRNESAAVRDMAQAFLTSRQIYVGQNHQQRINLMKRNLLGSLAAMSPAKLGGSQPLPKLLVKLGALHLGRGLSSIAFGEFYDVGNLVQNLADAHDQQTLHLLVMGRQGTHAIGGPTGKAEAYQTITEWPATKPLLDQANASGWTLLDLRPARRALTAGTLHVVSPALERLLLGYDFAVVIGETTASHPF